MKNKPMQLRSKSKQHKKPEQLHDSTNPQTSTQQSSPWIKQLTTAPIDPIVMRHHLIHAGESLRYQTCSTLQRQNGNRYIQREGPLNIASVPGLDDMYDMGSSKILSPGAGPVPIPYPISATSAPSQTSSKVKLTAKDVMTTQSKIGKSSGDEAGTLKGLVSNQSMVPNAPYDAKVDFKSSPIVFIPSTEETDQVPVSRATLENPTGLKTVPEIGQNGGKISDQLENQINKNLSKGNPLPHPIRRQMETKFGTQFSDVRLHTDQEANTLSQKLSARAFTIGNDIFYNHNANPQDDRLLTHELSHVVQQQHMSNSGPMTVGPANDHLEQQASNFANNSTVNAYTYTFSEQRKQAVQRDFMDEFSLGNVAGVTGMGADISTGLHQLKNVALAQKLGMTAPQLTNLTQAPIVGTLSKIAAPIGLVTGSMDMMNEKKPWYERLVGGMSALGGATGTASTIAGWLGSGLFSAGGAAGMSAGAGTALTGGGAGLLSGAGAATALGSLGAVAGAGAGGYALGRLIDEGFGGIANLVAGDKKKDRTISGYGSRGLGWLDKKISGLWRDPSKPAYTQSIGWKLSEWLGI